VGTYFDSAGILQSAASGVPRFDFDPVTHAAKGILIENNRTNLFPNSAAFNLWNTTNTTMTANTTASPDGTTSADTWTRNSTANSYIGQAYTKTGSAITYAETVYAKQNVGNYVAIRMQGAYPARADMVVNLNTGTISTAANATSGFTSASGNIQNVGNGWYRITLTATTDTDTTVKMYISFNSGGGVLDATDTVSNSSGYLWGAQLEQGAPATSYIPTTTVAVTRGSDVFTIPTGSWYNQSVGTAVGTQSHQSVSGIVGYPMLWRFDDTTGNNRWNAFYIQSANLVGADGYNSGVSQGGSNFASSSTATTSIAERNALNNMRIAKDGVLGSLDTTWSPPTVTQFVGNISITSGVKWMQKFKYYPAALSDAQLQLLTQ
jgi:hypothetical protein